MRARGWVVAARSVHRNARTSLFWALLSRQRRNVKLVVALTLVVAVAGIMVANLTRGMVDRGIVDQAVPLWPFVRRAVPWVLVGVAASIASGLMLQRVAYTVELDMRVWLYTRIQTAELRRLDAVAGGQLVTRTLTDLQLLQSVLGVLPLLGALLPVLGALLVFITILSPPMGLLGMVVLPVDLWLIARFKDRLRQLSWADLNQRAEVMTAIDEPVRGIRVVRAFGREDHERRRLHAVADRAYQFALARVRLLARYDIVIRGFPYLMQGVILLAGARLVADGRLTLGTFLLAFQAGTIVIQVAAPLGDVVSAWQYVRSAQDRLTEMLALGNEPLAGGRSLPGPSLGLGLDGVSVELGERVVLDQLDLDVAPGELVMVVGGPGSGKSTLVAVAAGLLAPTRGRALLEAVPMDELDPVELRRSVRVVTEEPLLFALSLRDNLTMGAAPDVTDHDILAALEAAGAEDVPASLTGGLDGAVGDRGLTLSGGQRQRVAMARALLARPRLLVLDDALSAVNPSLEIDVLRRVRRFAPDLAILLVTRRDGARAVADEVRRLASGGSLHHLPGAAAPLAEVPAPVAELTGVGLHDVAPSLPEDVVADEREPTLRAVLRRFRAVAALAFVAVLAQALAVSSPDILFGRVVDLVEESEAAAYRWAYVMMAMGAVIGVTGYVFRVSAERFNQGVIHLLRRRVFHRLTRLGIDFYDREQPGEVAARVVNDLDTLLVFFQGPGFILVSNIARVLVAMGAILVIAPATAPVVIGGVVVIVGLTAIQLPLAMQANGWARDELGVVTAKFEEDFTARHEIRHLGALGLQLRRFVHACWERRRARWWVAVVASAYTSVIDATGQVLSLLVLWRAGEEVFAGRLSTGSALTVQLLAVGGTLPLGTIGGLYARLLEVRVSWDRVREPFRVRVLPVVAEGAPPCPAIVGPVAFDHVDFAYPHAGRQVLADVSFTMPAGGVTALVGVTGAGKSSVAKLLSRTYDPDVGRVVVSGRDLRDVDLAGYRSRIGIVPQDAFLFRGTVASNIAYGRPDASREDVEASAVAVGAHELLVAGPDGYDHTVEEEGRNLTHAQRQLIALARAWLARPELLVLDEATSSLDGDVEGRVLVAVASLGVTTLMVTHRHEVAARADHIVVLEGGRVATRGGAAEVAGEPAFRRLWAADDLLASG